MTAKRARILDDEDDFTAPARQAFETIFKRFDKDADGVLNQAELDAFAVFSNGAKFDEATLAEIRSYFNVNEHGHMTLRGFLEMFQVQTLGDEDETWKDLRTHGFNEQLEPVAEQPQPQPQQS
eukprot:jgi/Hompol1/178/HPOL_005248-RA